MACDTGSKPIEENENIITEENQNNEIKRKKYEFKFSIKKSTRV